MDLYVILAAAGKGERCGFKQNKILTDFEGEPLLMRTLSVFLNIDKVKKIIIAASETDLEKISELVKPYPIVTVALGGKTRYESIKRALELVDDGIVAVHDAARPFVSKELIERTIASAEKFGSGVAGIPITDTLSKTLDGYIISTKRNGLYALQTPQAFNAEMLKKAYKNAENSPKVFTDDSGVFCELYGKAKLVEGEKSNIKLTFKEDFLPPRVGCGFDLHRLVENRKLILGGVTIPHTKGLLGHSDADVLTHAVMDAMLSALSLGDIGQHFPDTDMQYKNADSLKLLNKVKEMIEEKGYRLSNLSACIMAQKPKLMPYLDKIATSLAKALSIKKELIGLTCTTLEGIGTVGREEGIAVQAYCRLAPL